MPQPEPDAAEVQRLLQSDARCPYEVLGIRSDSDGSTVRRAFRALAARVHPDRNAEPDAAEAFKRIGEAYSVLCDPAQRREHDERTAAGAAGAAADCEQPFPSTWAQQQQQQRWQPPKAKQSYRRYTAPGSFSLPRGCVWDETPDDYTWHAYDSARGYGLNGRGRWFGHPGAARVHVHSAPPLLWAAVAVVSSAAVLVVASTLAAMAEGDANAARFTFVRDERNGYVANRTTVRAGVEYWVKRSFYDRCHEVPGHYVAVCPNRSDTCGVVRALPAPAAPVARRLRSGQRVVVAAAAPEGYLQLSNVSGGGFIAARGCDAPAGWLPAVAAATEAAVLQARHSQLYWRCQREQHRRNVLRHRAYAAWTAALRNRLLQEADTLAVDNCEELKRVFPVDY
eukprot:TRINITY_DN6802_c0_g1_i1.p1 TRINITY_DN6802_c0_g1~~TRINITY_DN6802_c0_g1_i1.p1  ORF type:complete len:423 (+),score=119.99 TRINITY_DN6802_c0_g1_i1:83-1270(+)